MRWLVLVVLVGCVEVGAPAAAPERRHSDLDRAMAEAMADTSTPDAGPPDPAPGPTLAEIAAQKVAREHAMWAASGDAGPLIDLSALRRMRDQPPPPPADAVECRTAEDIAKYGPRCGVMTWKTVDGD